jgi:hypothetical protein
MAFLSNDSTKFMVKSMLSVAYRKGIAYKAINGLILKYRQSDFNTNQSCDQHILIGVIFAILVLNLTYLLVEESLTVTIVFHEDGIHFTWSIFLCEPISNFEIRSKILMLTTHPKESTIP